MSVLERCLQLGGTWQFIDRTPAVAAALGYAYAGAGWTEEALALVAGAVNEFRAGRDLAQSTIPIPYFAGRASLLAGRIDEATNYAREALALMRRLGARGSESHALSLTADISAASGTDNAEGYYREALALAEPSGMRPKVAHCHFGLGKLHRRRGDRDQAQEHLTTAIAMYGEMGMTYWLKQAEAELS
jgi:tetratricopeptide (TPR) repeat protein